ALLRYSYSLRHRQAHSRIMQRQERTLTKLTEEEIDPDTAQAEERGEISPVNREAIACVQERVIACVPESGHDNPKYVDQARRQKPDRNPDQTARIPLPSLRKQRQKRNRKH